MKRLVDFIEKKEFKEKVSGHDDIMVTIETDAVPGVLAPFGISVSNSNRGVTYYPVQDFKKDKVALVEAFRAALAKMEGEVDKANKEYRAYIESKGGKTR